MALAQKYLKKLSGSGVMILKIFSPKFLEKNRQFLLKLLPFS
jgi:hypothetical protein